MFKYRAPIFFFFFLTLRSNSSGPRTFTIRWRAGSVTLIRPRLRLSPGRLKAKRQTRSARTAAAVVGFYGITAREPTERRRASREFGRTRRRAHCRRPASLAPASSATAPVAEKSRRKNENAVGERRPPVVRDVPANPVNGITRRSPRDGYIILYGQYKRRGATVLSGSSSGFTYCMSPGILLLCTYAAFIRPMNMKTAPARSIMHGERVCHRAVPGGGPARALLRVFALHARSFRIFAELFLDLVDIE